MTAALLLAALAAPPSVHVQTPGRAGELRSWLVVRLLEEGYAVAPQAASASVDLRVEATAGGWVVRATGGTSRQFDIASGEPAIEQLEILHRAVDALHDAGVRPPPSASTRRIALQLDAAMIAADRDLIEPRIANAVLQHGDGLAAPGGAHDAALCVRADDEAFHVSAAATRQACTNVARTETAIQRDAIARDTGRVTLEVLEGGVDPAPFAEQAIEPSTVAESSAAPPILGEPVDESRRPPRPPRRRGIVARIAARGGLVARTRPVDGALGGGLRIGREPGPAALLDASVWLRRSRPVRVVEAVPALGFSWRFSAGERWSIDLAGLAGLQIHRWRIATADAPVTDSGTRYDWSLEGRIETAFTIARGFQVLAGLGIGGAGRPRTHVLDEREVWARGAFRIGAHVGVSYGFGAQR